MKPIIKLIVLAIACIFLTILTAMNVVLLIDAGRTVEDCKKNDGTLLFGAPPGSVRCVGEKHAP